jgi:hypothetical protein
VPADSDKDVIWRDVESQRAAAESAAPDGYQAIVEVHLVNRPAPVVVEKVETRRTQPWVLFHSYGPGGGDPSHESDVHVFVTLSQIMRIELRYERAGRFPPGFTVTELREADA